MISPVDVELTVVGQVVVDDQGNLLHVDPSGPHVCGDQHTTVCVCEGGLHQSTV